MARIEMLRWRYVDNLPEVMVARDPFDDASISVRLDDGGLDGPFWDAQNPARPAETMPTSFVVLTGAMRLSRSRLETTPYLCLPGPPVPFVVPALLGRDSVKAVLATVHVGAHLGYAVSYFSPRPVEPPPLPNDWGRREYRLRDRGRPTTMGSSFDVDPKPDFDLRPWIDAGKLAWIAPGDTTMRLRWAAPGCIYLTMRGLHQHHRVQIGQVF